MTVALSVLVAVILTGFMVGQIVQNSQNEQIRAETVRQLNNAVVLLQQTGVSSPSAKLNDTQLPSAAREAALKGATVSYLDETTPGHAWIWAASTVKVDGATSIISLRSDFSEVQVTLAQIRQATIVAGAASVVGVSAAALFISGRIARRLVTGAKAADRLAAGDASISVRSAIGPGRDEVDRFAAAVDSMAAKLTERALIEQRFSGDLAHELRTPIAGLVASAALLDDSRPAHLVRASIHRLRSLVEDLLEVSRLESGVAAPKISSIPLDPSISSFLQRLQLTPPLVGVNIEFTPGAPGTVLRTELRRFERILGNLVTNAAVHGAGTVSVTTVPGLLTVQDEGTGYPTEILSDGPSRHKSSSGGMGLGLVIAIGQARVLGLRLTLDNARYSGGARAQLHLDTEPESFKPDGATRS
ncbi:sensor histidine kinase [Arthrobacter sp. TMN-49]